MKLNNDKIQLNDSIIELGASFEDVRSKVSDVAFAIEVPNDTGIGYVIIKNESFYGLYGTVTLYFQNNILTQLYIKPEFNRYDLSVTDVNSLKKDKAIDMISKLSENGLRDAFGPELDSSDCNYKVFCDNNIYILTYKSSDNNQFSLVLKSKNISYPEISGYVLAPKKLVDNKQKVRYMYREKPEKSSDSGWRFFSGDETDEYVNNPDNIGIYDIKTIISIDEDIIPFLNNLPFIAFERENTDEPFSISE